MKRTNILTSYLAFHGQPSTSPVAAWKSLHMVQRIQKPSSGRFDTVGFWCKVMLGKCSKSAFSMFQPKKKDIPEHTKPVSCESFRVFDPYPHLSLLIRVPTFRSLLFWSFFSNNFTKAGKPAWTTYRCWKTPSNWGVEHSRNLKNMNQP